MKKLKIIPILLLCIAVIASGTPVQAMLAPLVVGDVDRDYEMTILDAALIQRFLAGIREPDELQITLSDTDSDGEMTIGDVTTIQRELAGIQSKYVRRDIYDYYVGDVSFHSSAEIMEPGFYMTGKEVYYVGVPVTFTVKERWGAKPISCSLSIDGETVRQVDADGYDPCTMTYTFTEEGTYNVSTVLDCHYGASSHHTRDVQVVSLPEDGSPVVMGAVFNDASRMSSGDSELTVYAAGGTGNYQYSYDIYFGDPGLIFDIPEDNSLPCISNIVYSSGYIDSNTINLMELISSYGLKDYWGKYPTINVQIKVRDSAGNESQPVSAGYIGYELCA